MARSICSIATADGRRLIKRLLTHWGHKFDVVLDEQHGEVPFDTSTHARFDADAEQLKVVLEAADAQRLQQMQGVIGEHLQRMARGESLQIDWTPAEAD